MLQQFMHESVIIGVSHILLSLWEQNSSYSSMHGSEKEGGHEEHFQLQTCL